MSKNRLKPCEKILLKSKCVCVCVCMCVRVCVCVCVCACERERERLVLFICKDFGCWVIDAWTSQLLE